MFIGVMQLYLCITFEAFAPVQVILCLQRLNVCCINAKELLSTQDVEPQ